MYMFFFNLYKKSIKFKNTHVFLQIRSTNIAYIIHILLVVKSLHKYNTKLYKILFFSGRVQMNIL